MHVVFGQLIKNSMIVIMNIVSVVICSVLLIFMQKEVTKQLKASQKNVLTEEVLGGLPDMIVWSF